MVDTCVLSTVLLDGEVADVDGARSTALVEGGGVADNLSRADNGDDGGDVIFIGVPVFNSVASRCFYSAGDISTVSGGGYAHIIDDVYFYNHHKLRHRCQ